MPPICGSSDTSDGGTKWCQDRDADRFDRRPEIGLRPLILFELKPDAWEPWSGRAFTHFHRKQWDSAIVDFPRPSTWLPRRI
jgi:hypothetical protein